MNLYFYFFSLKVPAYGFLIALGIVLSNILIFLIRNTKALDFDNVLILEGYAMLGGMIGSKLLYLIISAPQIDWSRITDLIYLQSLMNKGFVFFGGLIFGLFAVFLAYKIHKIPAIEYLEKIIFIIPLTHAFGRIGCFCAGCCYGIPYSGWASVVFPKNSFAPSGVPLLPIQLIESTCLFILAFTLFVLILKNKEKYSIYIYIVSYSIIRFILEFFRYDYIRGQFGGFSTSQWISLLLIVIVIIFQFKGKKATQ